MYCRIGLRLVYLVLLDMYGQKPINLFSSNLQYLFGKTKPAVFSILGRFFNLIYIAHPFCFYLRCLRLLI
jgi:hypothetical protein